jgi:hypothetical protein
MGAAFADIHEIHSADLFAAAALGRLETLLERARTWDPLIKRQPRVENNQ